MAHIGERVRHSIFEDKSTKLFLYIIMHLIFCPFWILYNRINLRIRNPVQISSRKNTIYWFKYLTSSGLRVGIRLIIGTKWSRNSNYVNKAASLSLILSLSLSLRLCSDCGVSILKRTFPMLKQLDTSSTRRTSSLGFMMWEASPLGSSKIPWENWPPLHPGSNNHPLSHQCIWKRQATSHTALLGVCWGGDRTSLQAE